MACRARGSRATASKRPVPAAAPRLRWYRATPDSSSILHGGNPQAPPFSHVSSICALGMHQDPVRRALSRARAAGVYSCALLQAPQVADGPRRARCPVGFVNEGLDGGQPRIAAVAQCVEDRSKGEAALTGTSPIGIVEMHMRDDSRG